MHDRIGEIEENFCLRGYDAGNVAAWVWAWEEANAMHVDVEKGLCVPGSKDAPCNPVAVHSIGLRVARYLIDDLGSQKASSLTPATSVRDRLEHHRRQRKRSALLCHPLVICRTKHLDPADL